MKTVPISRGLQVLVDDDDYEPVMARAPWTALRGKGGWYAYHNARKGQDRALMHRVILGAGPDEMVDHINGNGLDNRRANLRLCTNAENMRNVSHGWGRSAFKGVARHPHTAGRWRAYIVLNYRQHHLGYFDTEDEAARAYDAAARRLFGEFAKLNSPERVA